MRAVPTTGSGTHHSKTQGRGAHAPNARQAVACIESLECAHDILSSALLATEALDAELTLLHVVPPHSDYEGPHDPVSTNLKRQEAVFKVERLANDWENQTCPINTAVLEGRPADQICNWARSHRVDLTVLFARQDTTACESNFGVTSQKIIDKMPGSILIVPENCGERRTAPIRERRAAPIGERHSAPMQKLLILLDGSIRAESALPVAIQLAESKKSELVLVHAVPQLELTEIGPIESDDEDLKALILSHNEKKAAAYLNRLQAQLTDKNFPVSVRILKGGDVRRLLQQTIIRENADMVIISSHGQGGYPDVVAGNVARFLMGHIHTPLFIVRDVQERSLLHDHTSDAPSLRFPNHSAA